MPLINVKYKSAKRVFLILYTIKILLITVDFRTNLIARTVANITALIVSGGG